jgi:hypothetical protein
MKKPVSVKTLSDFGRIRLSKSFFMRDFLFSDIAAIHGFSNAPDDPDLAIAAGTRLCKELLEPLQDTFGRIAIRSAYRSAEVNGFGAEMQRTTNKPGYTCANNDANAGSHIWDRKSEKTGMGATACIVLPLFYDRFSEEGDWKKLAWWIHDHLPYSSMEFYPKFWAFNLAWSEKPARTIYSRIPPETGYLTRPDMDNWEGSHEHEWRGIV